METYLRNFAPCLLTLCFLLPHVFGQTSPQAPTPAQIEELKRLNATTIGLYQVNKYDEALKAAGKTLALAEELTGKEGRATADVLVTLGDIYSAQGNFKEGEQTYRRALAIYSKTPIAGTMFFAHVLSKFARGAFRNGNLSDAEKSHQQVLLICEKTQGSESGETVTALLNLGDFYTQTTAFRTAFSYYQRALSIEKKRTGSASLPTATAIYAYSCALHKSKNYEDALKLVRGYWEENQIPPAKEKVPLEVINSRANPLAKPPFPALAKASRAGGKVVVQALIDTSGKVIAACEVSGHPLLLPGALQSAYNSPFIPVTLNGKPIPVVGLINYHFVLD
jgi:tetratricopeptide (TPR) repeat protein